MYKEKQCPVCGKVFSPDNARMKYCSVECRAAAAKQRTESEKSKVTRICEWCGNKFHPRTNTQRYCDSVHYAVCEVCGKSYEIDLSKQDKRRTCSKECSYQLRFKDGNPLSDPDVRNKAKQTLIEHYGVDHPMRSNIIKSKQRATMEARYGDWFTRTDEYRTRAEATNQARYHADWFLQTDEGKQKLRSTYQDKYGVSNAMKVPGARDRQLTTVLQKYGVTNVLQNPDVRSRCCSTLMCRYGVDSYSKTDSFKRQFKQTCLLRYGVDNPNKSYVIQQKIATTNLLRYGHRCVLGSPKVRDKITLTLQNRYGVNAFSKSAAWKSNRMQDPSKLSTWMQFLEDPKSYLETKSELPTYAQLEFELGVTATTIGYWINTLGLQHLVRYTLSTMEDEVVNCIYACDSNIRIIRHARSIVPSMEFDIFLPDYQLAIECNPTVTHNSSISDPWGGAPKHYKYHQNKSRAADERGVFLFHIFGYEWKHRRQTVESMLRNLLGCSTVIYARKCELREVSPSEARKFLLTNHRQGPTGAKLRYGLYFNEELVSLMTFGHVRGTMGNISSDTAAAWELVRFCNKLNTSVVGGASKLFKRFIDDVDPESVLSFSDCAHTRGKLYEILGFTKITISDPGYVWVDTASDTAYHRANAQKRNIARFLDDPDIDLSSTETDIMLEHGFVQVFDSGTIRWEWHT